MMYCERNTMLKLEVLCYILCPELVLIQVGSTMKKAFVTVDLDDMTFVQDTATYTYPCRCGETGGFAITEDDLEKGRDIVECRGCSSWIRVSYEMVSEQ
jgi:hypothetical protein